MVGVIEREPMTTDELLRIGRNVTKIRHESMNESGWLISCGHELIFLYLSV